MRQRLPGRKLLIASIGVAAVSYVACTTDAPVTSGNLVAPPPQDASSDVPTSGNLMGPPDARPDAPADAATDVAADVSNDADSDGSADAATE